MPRLTIERADANHLTLSFDPSVPDLPRPTPGPAGGICFDGAWPGAPSPQAPPTTTP